MGKNKRSVKLTERGDEKFDIFNTILMVVILLVIAWPVWYVCIASVSDPAQVGAGRVVLWPKGFTLQAYERIVNYSQIWTGYFNTIVYTGVGTLLNVVLTICAAYPLSRQDFMPRKFFLKFMLITMYFSGGMVPTYLVMKGIGAVNTIWAMILPGACSVTNMLITRTYFESSIPPTLREAAELDGANCLDYLVKIVLPLSKPVIAVITLYYAVGHWNDFYNALIYITRSSLYPLQMFLRELLFDSREALEAASTLLGDSTSVARMQLAEQLKYSSIIVATIPVLIMYPFVQKYFVKGVMIGAVKG